MSTTDLPTAEPAADEHADAHEHPTDRKYVSIAIILAVLTTIEILLFVFEDDLSDAIVKIGLLGLMAIKFWIVGAYFMHLKFDDNILVKLFMFGLLLAIAVYVIMLAAFEFFNSGIEDPGLPTP